MNNTHPKEQLILCFMIFISFYFILFIFLYNTYLIFDFICLTLSLADTHGIAKYARTYIQKYTHTRTHKNKDTHKKNVTTTANHSHSLR